MAITKEFKEFISKGNVIDLAVGVVIGAAFGNIVNSLVEDILMPPLGMLIGGVNFSDLQCVIKAAVVGENGAAIAAVTINYGHFIQVAISFVMIALSIFLFVVKPMNAMKKKEEAKPSAPPAPGREEVLLTEIRDLLKK